MSKFKRIISIVCAICALSFAAGCAENSPEQDDTVSKTTSHSTEATSGSTSTTTEEPTTTTTKKNVPESTKKKQDTSNKKDNDTEKPAQSGYKYAYAGFNPVVTDMSVGITKILLNRHYMLPEGYVPKLKEAVKGSGVMLDENVAPHYQEMYDAAKLSGITLTPISGYRTVARQTRNFENRIALYESQGYNKVDATVKASEIILLPRTSEHNAGLAMDICSLEVSFENSEEFSWLQEHAHEYGFIMRYPKDKTHITNITYEPWHYRYVGVEIAAQLKSSGMVLEEYLNKA